MTGGDKPARGGREEEEGEGGVTGSGRGEMGNAEPGDSLLKGNDAAAAGKEIQEIRCRTPHLRRSQDDAHGNEDRREPDLFGPLL